VKTTPTAGDFRLIDAPPFRLTADACFQFVIQHETYIIWYVNLLSMAECGNCGEFVTDQYVRVFAPTGMDTVQVCPSCPDMVRRNGDVREAKSPGQ
jgi:predicted metal-binding protein